MKPLDLIRLILGNLSRRKARVALTAIGVVIGTAAVVILISLAIGLQRNANEQLYAIGDLTQIQVMPAYGGEGMVVEVARPGGGGSGNGEPVQTRLLTNSALQEMQAIPGVQSVIPREWLMAEAMVKYQKLVGWVGITGVETNDLVNLGLESTEGSTGLSRGNAVIGVMVPNNFQELNVRPGQEPAPPPELLGQQIQIVVIKYDEQGNQIHKNLSLRVSGILKETRSDPDWTIYLPLDQIKILNEWAQGRRINYNKEGYGQVVVKVEDVK